MTLIKAVAESMRREAGPCFLMLDEISSVKEWPRVIKALVDAGELDHIALLLIGSSAVEIKRGYERMPGRRGAGFDKAFLPMSFADYCKSIGVIFPETTLDDVIVDESAFQSFQLKFSLKKTQLLPLLEGYLQWGRIPKGGRGTEPRRGSLRRNP